MKKYVVSDLHGDGLVYATIISYLESIHPKRDFKLYVNGDLIDRGENSADMLLDVYDKMTSQDYPIELLAGNHELMMWNAFEERRKEISGENVKLWLHNNEGKITDEVLEKRLRTKEKILEVVDFISNLRVCETLEEKIGGKEVLLVHASCPSEVEKTKKLKLKDLDEYSYYVWARKNDPMIPFRCRIGNNDYFSIVGHTPNHSMNGFEYHKDENYFNIDGGLRTPLVQINDEFLRVLTFHQNGNVIAGNYFSKGEILPFSKSELEMEKKKVKKIGERK